jgi:hypothetical protein
MTDISCDWNVLLNDYLDMTSLINKTYLYYGSAARMSNKYYRDSNYNYHHVDPVDQGKMGGRVPLFDELFLTDK